MQWKKIKYGRLYLIFFFLLSCATVPTTPAPWAATPAAIRTVFPDGEYIAQRGRGRTREAAEANAATEIARFFTSQISAAISYRETYSEANGNAVETSEAINETFVKAQIDLFGIR
jgi:hypothetical protein